MLPSRLEALLFDAGGTLVTLDYPFIAERARQHGCSVHAEALARAEVEARRAVDRALGTPGVPRGSDGSRRPDYFAALLTALGLEGAALRGLLAELEAAHRRENLWRLPHPGAEETLRALAARGLRTAVVSNADGRVADMLGRLGLAAHLELIVDSHWEGVEKPDPEIFHRTLARLYVPAERAAYVGDIYAIDVVGARAAGLAPVLLDPLDSFAGLDCAKIASLGELLTAVPEPERGAP